MSGIASPKGTETLLKKSGNTDDIIEGILDTIPAVKSQTTGFSRQFSPDQNGLKKLWWWVKREIHYIEDPLGVQWIREPARLYADRQGDCKSFTVFIVSVLENIGIPYLVRFVNTERPGSKIVNHVYPVAIMNGKHVPMDAVYGHFDREHPYYYNRDYSMSQIYRLAGIGAATEADIARYENEVLNIADSIPDDVLMDDITEMSQGEYSRYMSASNFSALAENNPDPAAAARYAAASQAIQSGSIAGIGNLGSDAGKIQAFINLTSTQTGKAFSAPVLVLPPDIAGVGKLGDKLKNLAKNVLNAWKKVINWIFKRAIPIAAPFFLYTFIKSKLKGKSAKKRKSQNKVLAWIQKTGKFDTPDAVIGAVKVGISKVFGQPVDQVLKGMARGKKISGRVGVIPAIVAAIGKALPIIIEIVKKVAGIFKKKDTPSISAMDAPNPDELYSDIDESKGITTGTPGTGSGLVDNKMVLLGGAAALGVGLYLYSNSKKRRN